MRIKLLTLLVTLLLLNVTANAQINMADSTAQAITYWEKGEKQNFTVTQDKIQLTGEDTTKKERLVYDVEVTVLKANKKSYTIKWKYKNISSNTDDQFTQKILGISKDLEVIYKTDELGVFLEVVNWKEIRDFINEAMTLLKKEFKNKQISAAVFDDIASKFSSKEVIEAVSINDIQQFHMFHGGKYKLGEQLDFKMQVPNIYTSTPFDSDVNVYLDEIDTVENNFIIRSSQVVDSEQLLKATLTYLRAISEKMNVEGPDEESMKDVLNETLTASRIHNTGWVIYSVQTKTVFVNNVTVIDERIIEIK